MNAREIIHGVLVGYERPWWVETRDDATVTLVAALRADPAAVLSLLPDDARETMRQAFIHYGSPATDRLLALLFDERGEQ